MNIEKGIPTQTITCVLLVMGGIYFVCRAPLVLLLILILGGGGRGKN